VVHTHRHLDHRAGDPQFAALPKVQVVGFDIDSVRKYYGFIDWPNGLAQVDLGGRTVDVIPTPGHNPTHVSFYDRNTRLFFSGDFLLPGRLLVEDAAADLASAKRVATFVQDRPVTAVLGGHIEINAKGETFDWGTRYHPDEHVLPMTKADLLALPRAVSRFNGFYSESGGFVMIDPNRDLLAMAIAAGAVLMGLGVGVRRYLSRRRRVSGQSPSSAGAP
jgi:glyoxylase-like metal-dependent hydrolase (beta-lactamase superfamily II)